MQLLRIDWNVLFTIINLLILYFGLRKFLIKPVTNVMEQRRQMIEGQMADAKKTTEQANELKSQYEDADRRADATIERARKTIETERKQALDGVETQIAGLAMMAAGKVLGKADAAEQNKLMYEQFLAKTGGCNDTDSK